MLLIKGINSILQKNKKQVDHSLSVLMKIEGRKIITFLAVWSPMPSVEPVIIITNLSDIFILCLSEKKYTMFITIFQEEGKYLDYHLRSYKFYKGQFTF